MDDLIAKYLFDKLTLNEDSRLKYWIKQSPENQMIFNHSLETLKLLESSGNSAFAGADPSWQKLRIQIEEINRSEEPLVNRGLYFIMNTHITRSKLARVAAIMLLLIGFVFSFQYIVLYDGGAQTQPFQLASGDDFGRLELTTGDEIDVVFLPDKSFIRE